MGMWSKYIVMLVSLQMERLKEDNAGLHKILVIVQQLPPANKGELFFFLPPSLF